MRLFRKTFLLAAMLAACGDGGDTSRGSRAESRDEGKNPTICADTLTSLRARPHAVGDHAFRLLVSPVPWKEASETCGTMSEDDGFRLATAAEVLSASELFTARKLPRERALPGEVLRPSGGFSLEDQARGCHIDLWVADAPLAYKSLNKTTSDALVVSDDTRLDALCIKP